MKEIYPEFREKEVGGREREGHGRAEKRGGGERARWREGKKEKLKKPEVAASLFFYPSHERRRLQSGKKKKMRNFPGVQWLRLQASTVRGMGSRVSKLRSCMLCGVARKKAGKGMKRWRRRRERRRRRRRKSLTSRNVRISIFPLLPYGG